MWLVLVLLFALFVWLVVKLAVVLISLAFIVGVPILWALVALAGAASVALAPDRW